MVVTKREPVTLSGSETFHSVFRIWKEITTYQPLTQGEQSVHQQLISEICSMTQNHRTRVETTSLGTGLCSLESTTGSELN